MEDAVFRQDESLFASFECHVSTTERPDFPMPPHWHLFAEIIRVRTGSLHIQYGDKSCLLPAGHAVLINPLTRHCVDYGEPGVPAEYEVFRMSMDLLADLPSYTTDLRALMLEAERRGFSMILTPSDLNQHYLGLMLDALLVESTDRRFGYDLRIRALLYLISTDLIRRWIAKGLPLQDYASRIDPIYDLPSYIVRHIEEPLKVEDLAEHCGLSYPWFARRFHQVYGISCKEMISRIRIRRVEHYLLFTECDLNYISRHTGYSDCSHLVRDFKKLRNTTPGRFRAENRKIPPAALQFPQTY